MERKDFTVEANSSGYMIFYKGKPIGGAGIKGSFSGRGKAVQNQVRDYREQAKNVIDCILAGLPGRYAKTIADIDGGMK